MANGWSKDTSLHSGPYAIGYTPYALFFGAGGLAGRGRQQEITSHRLSRLRKNYNRASRALIACKSGIREKRPAGCSKRPSSKAAASEEARRTLRYVEPLSDARTKLADFFSILLEVESYLRIRVTKMFADPHLLLVLAQ